MSLRNIYLKACFGLNSFSGSFSLGRLCILVFSWSITSNLAKLDSNLVDVPFFLIFF